MHTITDNFLEEEEFAALRDTISHSELHWFYNSSALVTDTKSSSGYFCHPVYTANIPCSSIYDSFGSIINKLDVAILSRIRINLNPIFPQPYISEFHTDIKEKDMDKHTASQWTTSILYINTNNGYTELEDGTKIESVANRLVSYPLSTRHRVVTQTDKPARYVINFGYLKRPT